jgi:hypothetical protein
MGKKKPITADRYVLALISAFRMLVLHLSQKGLIDEYEYVSLIQQIAHSRRESGDPNNIADALHSLAEHILGSPSLRDRE